MYNFQRHVERIHKAQYEESFIKEHNELKAKDNATKEQNRLKAASSKTRTQPTILKHLKRAAPSSSASSSSSSSSVSAKKSKQQEEVVIKQSVIRDFFGKEPVLNLCAAMVVEVGIPFSAADSKSMKLMSKWGKIGVGDTSKKVVNSDSKREPKRDEFVERGS